MYKEVSKGLMRAVSSVVSGSKLLEGKKEEYQKFFKAALKKFNAKSPASLDAKKKKEFFDYIEKNWKAADESVDETKLKEAVKRYVFSIDDTIDEEEGDDEDEKKAKKEKEEPTEADSKDDLKNVISKLVQDEIKKASAPEQKEIKLSGKKDKVKV